MVGVAFGKEAAELDIVGCRNVIEANAIIWQHNSVGIVSIWRKVALLTLN